MQPELNTELPQIMHIDLNSCFATVEQQARPLLRGKPVAVTNRKTARCCVVAASYEAKVRGVRVGMRRDEAELLIPELILVETDPPKYHYVYQVFMAIMLSYAPDVRMKSIDEGVIDFHGTREHYNTRQLTDIGLEIKQRLKDELGTWMRCNVGIAPNRFLAKQAASLHKPDGMDTINHHNLRQVLGELKLTDLTGIAEHNEARLNACGITTPLQFLAAPAQLLRRHVFKSVCGEDWYQRLRGWEVDDYESTTKSVGRQFVLDTMRPNDELIRSRLAYLCETTGMKLRYKNLCAQGLLVYAKYQSGDYWYERKLFRSTFFSNAEICRRAMLLFNHRPRSDYVREMGITCYHLQPSNQSQLSLLEVINRETWLSEAVDQINQRHGEFMISFARSTPSKPIVKQKVPFGSTRYFELLCQEGG